MSMKLLIISGIKHTSESGACGGRFGFVVEILSTGAFILKIADKSDP